MSIVICHGHLLLDLCLHGHLLLGPAIGDSFCSFFRVFLGGNFEIYSMGTPTFGILHRVRDGQFPPRPLHASTLYSSPPFGRGGTTERASVVAHPTWPLPGPRPRGLLVCAEPAGHLLHLGAVSCSACRAVLALGGAFLAIVVCQNRIISRPCANISRRGTEPEHTSRILSRRGIPCICATEPELTSLVLATGHPWHRRGGPSIGVLRASQTRRGNPVSRSGPAHRLVVLRYFPFGPSVGCSSRSWSQQG